MTAGWDNDVPAIEVDRYLAAVSPPSMRRIQCTCPVLLCRVASSDCHLSLFHCAHNAPSVSDSSRMHHWSLWVIGCRLNCYSVPSCCSTNQNKTHPVPVLTYICHCRGVERLLPVGCVAQRYNVGLWPANFPVLRSTCSWWVTTYAGKPSAIGQPTRPTQPVSPSGSINE